MAPRVQATASTYNRFLREGGLERLLKDALSARSADEGLDFSVLRVDLGDPPLDPDTCRGRGETYGAPLTLQLALIHRRLEDDGTPPTIDDVRLRTLSHPPVPLMTDEDTLVLDGVDHTLEATAKDLPGLTIDEGSARLTPFLGVPLELGIDRGLLVARLDGGRKLPATLLLRALGMTRAELLELVYRVQKVHLDAEGALSLPLDEDVTPTTWVAAADVLSLRDGAVIVPAGARLSPPLLSRLRRAGIWELPATLEDLAGCVLADDVIDEDTGEVLGEPNERVTEALLARARGRVRTLKMAWIDEASPSSALQRTLERDGIEDPYGPLHDLVGRRGTMEAAAITVARHLRGMEELDEDAALSLFQRLIGWEARYDLLAAGRGELLARLHAGAERAPTPAITTLLLDDLQPLVRAMLGAVARAGGEEIERRCAEEKLCELAFRLDLEPIAAAVKARLRDETELRDEFLEREISPLSWLGARRTTQGLLRAQDIESLAEAYGPGLPRVRRCGGYRLVRAR